MHATQAISAMLSIAGQCQKTHEEMVELFATSADAYFRFNVEHGLQSVGIANSDKIIQVGAHTRAYLNSDRTVNHLQALAFNPFLQGMERSSETHSNQPARARKLRLLSLGHSSSILQYCCHIYSCTVFSDGGGVRGISSLLILKEIMQDVMAAENKLRQTRNAELLTGPPRPCNYFDLIGGTEAGG
jgi:hypothetical protein